MDGLLYLTLSGDAFIDVLSDNAILHLLEVLDSALLLDGRQLPHSLEIGVK